MSTGRQVVKKLIIGAVALTLLFGLFLYTLRQTESTPYVMGTQLLTGWQVVEDTAFGPDAPVLSLVPSRELTMSLFQQVFERTMESMNAPPSYGIALVLRGEFDRALAGHFDMEELATLARDAGLEDATLQPTCLAVRTGASATEPRRTFYVQFDLPALRRFRNQVGEEIERRGGDKTAFDPAAVAPVLYLAATDGGFREHPPVTEPSPDECVAPVELTAS